MMTRRLGLVLGGGVLLLFIAPLLAGLIGTVLPAFGMLPQLAETEGFTPLFNDPRFWPSARLTLQTGLAATVISLLLTTVCLVCVQNTRLWRWVIASLPPLLAIPHAALAVGVLFLISPSGWIARLLSPWLTGWERPPTAWVVPDAEGLSLIIGLVIKEFPFLLLAGIAQLQALQVDESLTIGRTLGYSPARCWSRLILPRLYPRIRFTLLIVLAFNLSVVDMALLLGPGNPPTFSVFLMTLVNDPDSRAAASAGALVLAVGVFLVFGALYLMERVISFWAQSRRANGRRGTGLTLFRHIGQWVISFVLLFSVFGLIMLALWSFTRRWRFPHAMPQQWSTQQWTTRGDILTDPLLSTLGIALTTAVLAMVASVIWLELERMNRVPKFNSIWFIPLLVPQVTFLFGWQAFALLLGADGHWLTVVYSHWVYALPYVILILAIAWREQDPNWHHAANTLGAGYFKVLRKVHLPMMSKQLSQAAAVAIAVSVAQYLPTLLLGAGRHQTLAIELVTSFGGVDRRVIAALALLQSLLPLLAFFGALIVPWFILKPRALSWQR